MFKSQTKANSSAGVFALSIKCSLQKAANGDVFRVSTIGHAPFVVCAFGDVILVSGTPDTVEPYLLRPRSKAMTECLCTTAFTNILRDNIAFSPHDKTIVIVPLYRKQMSSWYDYYY